MLRPRGLRDLAGGHPDSKRRAGGGASSDLPLGVQAVGVAALLMAGLLQNATLAVVFLGQLVEGRLDDAILQMKLQVWGRLFLNLVV